PRDGDTRARVRGDVAAQSSFSRLSDARESERLGRGRAGPTRASVRAGRMPACVCARSSRRGTERRAALLLRARAARLLLPAENLARAAPAGRRIRRDQELRAGGNRTRAARARAAL